MQRILRSADQDNYKKRNAENINLMAHISEFDKQCNSKQEQLNMNTLQSQVATKINFTKKKPNNTSPFTLIQGISLSNQYGIVGQKKILQNSNQNTNCQNQLHLNLKKTQTDTQPSVINTQQSMVQGDDDHIHFSQMYQKNSDLDYSINAPFTSSSCTNNTNNEQSLQQDSENSSIMNITNNLDSRPQTSSSSSTSNYNQKNDSGVLQSTNTSELAQYYISNQFYEDTSHSNHITTNIGDYHSSIIDNTRPLNSSINQRSIAPNSFRGGKNQQDTLDKIKRIRMRSHQSAMRGTSMSNNSNANNNKNNGVMNMSNNNYAKLLKMDKGDVKEKSKQAIESIKSKLAINSENESVLVLKTQPQINQEEDYLNYLSIYQPNQTGSNFLNRKKNSCVLNDSSMPFKPISQNSNNVKQSCTFMSRTHTNGFSMSGEKQSFQMTQGDISQKNNPQNLQALCITPNKSFQGKSQSKSLNKSIDNAFNSKSDSKTNTRVTDENRKTLYKRMQNYNTFMRGKFAFHKLNKQKKELCNISNVLYNSLLENYEVEGMLKTFNPSLQNTQPKKRIYDAEDENENDSPDFNHMRKYYNKKYGIKLQQIENEKTDKLPSDHTSKYRNSYSNAHTPVKRSKESKNKKNNGINSASLANSANQKYYSQSATTQEDNKFSKVFTENLLNQSCTDFLNLCNLDDISQMIGGGGANTNGIIETEIDNTTSTQSSKKQHSNNNSYNFQNFTQFSSAVQNQCLQQSRRQPSAGNKTRKKTDIDLMPWENDYSSITKI